MKKSILLSVAALLLPFCSAWATTYYYAKMTAQVSTKSSGMGKVYAGTSQSTSSWDDSSMSSTSSTTTKGGSVTFYVNAQANDGYQFLGWSSSDGGTSYTSTTAAYSTSITTSNSTSPGETKTLFANFGLKQLDEFTVTFLAPENGSYTVNGTSVGSGGLAVKNTTVYTPTLVATAASGYAFDGWYEGGTKMSSSATYTPSYKTSCTVGPQFAKATVVTTLADLQASVQSNTLTEIPSGTEIVIPSGSTVTVASGKTLLVNGTLWVIGTLANSGSVAGGGTVAKITKVITQTGNGDGSPIATDSVNESLNAPKKYYKTTIADGSASMTGTAVETPQKYGAVVMRGGSLIAKCAWPTTDTPAVLSCVIDSTKAVNHITGFQSTCYYTDVAKGMAAVKGNTTTKMLVLLATKTVSNTNFSDAGLLTTMGNYKKLSADLGVMDLAGYTLTISPSYINSYTHVLLNGTLSETCLLYSGTITCINMTKATFSKVKEDYTSVIKVYDCAALPTISAYNGSNANKNSFNVYSSGSASYSTDSFKSPAETVYHIYGGKWSAQPDSTYIASTMVSDYEFQLVDGTYQLRTKEDKSVVELSNGSKYESFDEAVASLTTAFASTDSITMTMLKNATLSSAMTVPAGKTLEIELAGCEIAAANGFVVNNGAFVIGDQSGNLTSTGGRVTTASGNLIENYGTADVTYGYYTGNMVLNGGTFTTHHGYFTGSVSGTKAYADLRGGYFEKDVSSFLQTGYYRRSCYVGPYPKPSLSREYVTSDGGYWNYTFKTLPAEDLDLYNNSASQKSDYLLADWKRRAEVKSMVTPYLGYTVDIAVGFDRSTANGSATAKITKPYSMNKTLDRDVGAMPTDVYRVLSTYLTGQSAAQKTYAAFLSESPFPDAVFGLASETEANYGTVADLRIEFMSGSAGTYTTTSALMSEYVVIGAGQTNQAMIQPASGAATFYATVAEAVAAVAKGGTVKLCNSISATDTITVSKSCVIDMNGMDFAGALAAGTGYTMAVTESVPSHRTYLDKNHKVYTFTPVDYNITYDLDGGTNHADNPATYTIESETITLKEPTKTDNFFKCWSPAGVIEKGSTGDKTFTAIWNKPQAQIGSAKYETLTEAVGAAADGATVELLSDVALTASLEINASIVLAGDNYTLTGGGFTIAEGKTLTITNGYIGVTATEVGSGTLALKGGRYTEALHTAWSGDGDKCAAGYEFASLAVASKTDYTHHVLVSAAAPASDEVVIPVKDAESNDVGSVVLKADWVEKNASGDTAEEKVEDLNTAEENGCTKLENKILGLPVETQHENAIPVIQPVQTTEPEKISFQLGNVTVDETSGADVKYRVWSGDAPGEKKDVSAEASHDAVQSVDLPESGVRYYTIEVLTPTAK